MSCIYLQIEKNNWQELRICLLKQDNLRLRSEDYDIYCDSEEEDCGIKADADYEDSIETQVNAEKEKDL